MDMENIFYTNNMPDTTILIMHLLLLDLSQYFMMNSFTNMKMKDILLTMR